MNDNLRLAIIGTVWILVIASIVYMQGVPWAFMPLAQTVAVLDGIMITFKMSEPWWAPQ